MQRRHEQEVWKLSQLYIRYFEQKSIVTKGTKGKRVRVRVRQCVHVRARTCVCECTLRFMHTTICECYSMYFFCARVLERQRVQVARRER